MNCSLIVGPSITGRWEEWTDGILKRRVNKEMLIDMPTRWGSTFLMLQRLANLKYLFRISVHMNHTLPKVNGLRSRWWSKYYKYLTQQQFIFKNKISLRKNACFIGEKSCLNWRSWITIWLLLLPPPCNHAKSFYCEKRLSWQLFG